VSLTLTELKQVIDSGDFNQLIGEVESQVCDAKGRWLGNHGSSPGDFASAMD